MLLDDAVCIVSEEELPVRTALVPERRLDLGHRRIEIEFGGGRRHEGEPHPGICVERIRVQQRKTSKHHGAPTPSRSLVEVDRRSEEEDMHTSRARSL